MAIIIDRLAGKTQERVQQFYKSALSMSNVEGRIAFCVRIECGRHK